MSQSTRAAARLHKPESAPLHSKRRMRSGIAWHLTALLPLLFYTTLFGQSTTSDTDLTALQNQQQQLSLQQQIQQLTQQINSGTTNQDLQNQKDTLSLQKDLADLKLGIAQDKINAAKAAIGTINTLGLPSGQAQLSNVDIQPTIASYQEARNAVRTILAELYPSDTCTGTNDKTCFRRLDGGAVKLNCSNKLVLWSPVLSDVAVWRYFSTVVQNATDFLNGTKKPEYVTEPHKVKEAFAPAVAFAAIDAITSLSSLFKTDVTMSGVTVSGDEDALRLLLVDEFSKACAGTTAVNLNNLNPDIGNTKILESLNNLDKATRHAQDVANQVLSLDVVNFQAQLKKLQAKQDKLDALKKQKSDLELKKAMATKDAEGVQLQHAIDNVQSLITAASPGGGVDDYSDQIAILQEKIAQATAFATSVSSQLNKVANLQDALTKTDGNGVPVIVRLARAEAVNGAVSGSPTLLLNIVKIGGNNIVKRRAFWTSISFGGGSVLKYELRDADGLRIVKSGNVSIYANHKQDSHIGDVPE